MDAKTNVAEMNRVILDSCDSYVDEEIASKRESVGRAETAIEDRKKKRVIQVQSAAPLSKGRRDGGQRDDDNLCT